MTWYVSLVTWWLLCAQGWAAQPLDFVYQVRLYDAMRPAHKGPEGRGAGFFLSPEGEFVTARHLFEESVHAAGVTVEVRNQGTLTSCRVDAVLASPPGFDLVVVRVQLGLEKVNVPVVAATARRREPVTGFRPSALFPFAPTSGYVESVLPREIRLRGRNFWATGSSGSPVFNSAGAVIAMAVEMVNAKPYSTEGDWSYYALPVAKAIAKPRFAKPVPLADYLAELRKAGVRR